MIITSIQQFSKNNIIHYTVFTNDGLHVITESDRNIFDIIVGENGETQQINPNQTLFDAIDLYIANGGVVIDLNNFNVLKDARIAKKTQLDIAFNNSKLIRIEDTIVTLDIKHDTPQRDYFLNKFEQLSKEDMTSDTVITYHQPQDNVMYQFSAVPYIWNYIFINLFRIDRGTGFKEPLRLHNKKKYDKYCLDLNNANTIEDINKINCEFIMPNGITINVNQNAQNILNDINTPLEIKEIIQQNINANGGIAKLITEA